jgi:TRAP-type C4-dicarboxylate transport system substrate-binding protein
MALQTGVVQGAFRGTASMISFKEYEHLHHLVNIPTYGVCHIWIGMNAWKKLSPPQQQVLLDVAREIEQWSVGYYADMDTKGLAFLAEKGVNIRKFDPSEEARWRQALAKGATAWYLKQGGAAGQELLDIVLRYKR